MKLLFLMILLNYKTLSINLASESLITVKINESEVILEELSVIDYNLIQTWKLNYIPNLNLNDSSYLNCIYPYCSNILFTYKNITTILTENGTLYINSNNKNHNNDLIFYENKSILWVFEKNILTRRNLNSLKNSSFTLLNNYLPITDITGQVNKNIVSIYITSYQEIYKFTYNIIEDKIISSQVIISNNNTFFKNILFRTSHSNKFLRNTTKEHVPYNIEVMIITSIITVIGGILLLLWKKKYFTKNLKTSILVNIYSSKIDKYMNTESKFIL